MKLLAPLLALTLVVAATRDARADEASAIAAAGAWWKSVQTFEVKVDKKSPLTYAVDSNIKACKKLKVGKAKKQKDGDKVMSCLWQAYISLIPAEIDFTPTEDGWASSSEPSEMLFNKKQRKAIVAAQKDAWVLGNTFYSQDKEQTVQIFVAVGDDGKIRGVWMIAQDPYAD